MTKEIDVWKACRPVQKRTKTDKNNAYLYEISDWKIIISERKKLSVIGKLIMCQKNQCALNGYVCLLI